MTTYQITSSAGVDMGVYEGETPADALDAMARGDRRRGGVVKRASDRYWAAAGQDSGTCDALRWQWLSVCPMVVATGDDPEDLLDWAVSLTGHSDIYVHDSQAVEVSP